MMLYDCYYYYCHFLSKNQCFLQRKIRFFSKSYKESGIKIITINWNIAISCIYEWMKCCQKRKIINEWFILLIDNMRQAQPVWRTKSYNFKREAWEGNVFFFFKYFLKFFLNYLAGVISLWLMAVPFILQTPLFRRVS
jgi:hypothetical protein